MNADDVIPLPGTGMWARRAVVDAWVAAGSPPVNSATRLKPEQKELYDGWQAGLPGYAPADNPDDPDAPLAHVRGVALDIDATPARVAALSAAGLVRPYSYESWHWQLPGDIRRFPLITAFPTTAADAAQTSEEDDMLLFQIDPNTDGRWVTVDIRAKTYWQVRNGAQLDAFRADPGVKELAGPQSPALLEGMTVQEVAPKA